MMMSAAASTFTAPDLADEAGTYRGVVLAPGVLEGKLRQYDLRPDTTYAVPMISGEFNDGFNDWQVRHAKDFPYYFFFATLQALPAASLTATMPAIWLPQCRGRLRCGPVRTRTCRRCSSGAWQQSRRTRLVCQGGRFCVRPPCITRFSHEPLLISDSLPIPPHSQPLKQPMSPKNFCAWWTSRCSLRCRWVGGQNQGNRDSAKTMPTMPSPLSSMYIPFSS